ncbi:MAG: hypothetical protein M1834_000382 [Cirrosporium novae-zelandiae]|nr:MAG: hypothetical protein M1834_000382 [Cirrosporium novae-zelandiae]
MSRPFGRKAVCTHTMVTRLYGDNVQCQLCFLTPRVGWVYRCTQDHDGYLPESEWLGTMKSEYTSLLARKKELEALNQISPWISKAIDEGQYTPEQVDHIKRQKTHVKESIEQFEETYQGLKKGYDACMSLMIGSNEATTLPYADAETVFTMNEVEEVVKKLAEPNNPPPQLKARVFPHCRYKACHLCRATYRDRAWLSLDAAVDGKIDLPPSWELENRLISNVNIVKTIGLPKSSRLERAYRELGLYSRLSEFETLSDYGWSDWDESSSSTSASSYIDTPEARGIRILGVLSEQYNEENDAKSSEGFKDSIIRDYHSLLMTQRPPSSVEGKRSNDKKNSHEIDLYELDLGLWRNMKNELLEEASNIELPSDDTGLEADGYCSKTRDTQHNDADEDIEVDGGVALTEEAIEIHEADVITQA